MLEHIPAAVGHALAGVRSGLGKSMAKQHFAGAPEAIAVTSPAFGRDAPIPSQHTADGAGLSPPIAWQGLPAGTLSAVLVVEDADSPTPEPLVHAMVLDLPGRDGALAAGALKSPAGAGAPHRLGQNSFLRAEYLPPDPPSGHGPHRYAFQVFALDGPVTLAAGAGRGEVVAALKGHVIAKGVLIGTYERA